MIVLGIDPGSRRIGYGLVEKNGSALKFLAAGILKIENQNGWHAMLDVKNELGKIINKFHPETLAIEKLFFAKNRKTALDVAHTRGVIILAALENNLQIKEYAPNEIKAGITGYGMADKKAVLKMVKLFLKQPDMKIIDDASDALAIAIMGTK